MTVVGVVVLDSVDSVHNDMFGMIVLDILDGQHNADTIL